MHDVFDDIRRACALVAADARWVRIDHERLQAYADDVRTQVTTIDDNDTRREPFADLETTVAFVVTLDAINFGSGWFPYLRKPPGRSGYGTVAAAWRAHVEAGGAIDTGALRRITAVECAAIFDQPTDPAGEPMALMALFATALRDLAAAVDERHGGSFVQLVADARHSAAALVGQLARIPFFHDIAVWRRVQVPLFKRAQITVNDLARELGTHPLGRFVDIDRLTMFPDNLVPHVLRIDGVLRVDPGLVRRIEAVDDIAAGSEPEVEMRASALHAVELLVAALRDRGVDTRARHLDTFLWNRGGGPAYKTHPRHRTRSVYY